MAYSDFSIETAVTDLELVEQPSSDLFADVAALEPSDELRRWMVDFSELALNFGSELARSVFLLGPIFAEVMRRTKPPVRVFSGVSLDVDKDKGLSGVCDYVISRARGRLFLAAPICAVVEAKKGDLPSGLGQCAAEMVAVRILNENGNAPLPAVYGCVTTGGDWRFLKLEGNNLFVDNCERYLSDLPKLLGILVNIATAPAA